MMINAQVFNTASKDKYVSVICGSTILIIFSSIDSFIECGKIYVYQSCLTNCIIGSIEIHLVEVKWGF